MKRIKRLSAMVANQIAAGEVVERPASVLKELLENSLDAGATDIQIQVSQGGLSFIRVKDNGHGILKEDLALSLIRHATSKVSQITDLSAISSLGFRGEALASIVSVAKCVISSKPEKQQTAWSASVKGDELEPYLYPASPFDGTTVEVRDLFYNTPARRKFLKSVRTELNHIDHLVKSCALSHPQTSFTLSHQGKELRRYGRCDALAERVKQVMGPRFCEKTYYLEYANTGYQLRGWVGDEGTFRKSADCQYFFINHRAIRDKLTMHAIRNAYHQLGFDMDNGFASYVLSLEVPLDEVDVNVHPTKHEVRFSDPSFVHDFIQKSIKMALEEVRSSSESSDELPSDDIRVSVIQAKESQKSGEMTARPGVPNYTPSLNLEIYKPKPKGQSHFWRHYHFSFKQDLLVIDLKKDKNLIWDALLKKAELEPFPVRICLFPYPLSHPIKIHPKLEKLGFIIKKNMQGDYLLQGIPSFLKEQTIHEMIEGLEDTATPVIDSVVKILRSQSWELFKQDEFFEDFLLRPNMAYQKAMDEQAFDALFNKEDVTD